MTTKEQALNADLRAGLIGYHPVRVENAVGPGTPDIAYFGGWIESKVIDTFPVRPHTTVALPHYVKAQRAWHMAHRYVGGRVHVILRVMRTGEVFVFDAADAARHLGVDWTQADLRSKAVAILRPPWTETFQDWLATELDGNRKRKL